MDQDMGKKIKIVADMIVRAKRIVVFTGAGVSTESGIPDFRSPGGLWSKFDPGDFTIQKFMSSRDAQKKQWKMLVNGGFFENIEPNKAHYAVAELEHLCKLDCVITQNIDNLHQQAGNSPEKVFELHGNMQWARCMKCGRRYAIDIIRKQLLAGIEIPDCDHCHGILKPDVIFFGEALPEQTEEAAIQYAKQCDLFIIIGSSMVVYPAAYMPEYALDAGAKLVIINIGKTHYDKHADVLIHEKAGDIMERIVAGVRKELSESKRPCV